MTASSSVPSQKAPKAYNLHTSGVGFLNRLRFVKPEGKGKGYWCVSIGALYGVEDDNGRAESSLLDLRVVGAKAIVGVKELQAAFNDGKKIFVEFKAGDVRAEAFQYKNGARQGQWGSCIKGTLLKLRKAWVNGDLVIDTTEDPQEDQEPVLAEPSEVASVPAPAPTPTAAVPTPRAPTPASAETVSWRERLASRPTRITLRIDDPELNEKAWVIEGLGCYRKSDSGRKDRVLFTLIQAIDQVA